ncbi:MAG: hypothetical protein U5K74_01150, partial [Gemmatimonadaceae bacterium]|nr:hypothetical protein [Gemmatimonadaceae bacterium]
FGLSYRIWTGGHGGWLSAKKDEPEWLLEWRLKAYRRWLTMTEPTWPNVTVRRRSTTRSIAYYSAPKPKKPLGSRSTRWIRSSCETYEKLGISAARAEAARPAWRWTPIFD